MTLRTAAFLALVGMLLLTAVATADFITTVGGVLHDVIPMAQLLRALVYLFASVAVTVFFYVYSRSQSL